MNLKRYKIIKKSNVLIALFILAFMLLLIMNMAIEGTGTNTFESDPWFSVGKSADRNTALDPSLKSDVVRLREELSDLRSVIMNMKKQLNALTKQQKDILSALPHFSEQVDSASFDQGAIREELENEEYALQQNFENIKSAWIQEVESSDWANEASSTIYQALDQTKLVEFIDVNQVDCRSNLCFMEIEYDDPQVESEFLLSFSFDIGGILPNMTTQRQVNDDGSISMTLFLAADGYTFPGDEP